MNGKTSARLYSQPLRKLTPNTSLGFAAISYAKEILKVDLYPWQEWCLIHCLEIIGSLNKTWKFRFRTILIEVSRQNGKTVLSKVIASFFLNILCVESIFGTSLSADKAEEVWEAVVQDQENIPELSQQITRVARANGNKRLILKSGRQYKVGAPTRRAGRGDSNDLVLLDEIREQRDWETYSAAAASTVAKPNGLVICFSNAGDPDSIVLRQLRANALGLSQDFGGDIGDNIGLFEWSAPDKAATDDWDALCQANPALGYGRLTERALMNMRATYPENKFRSECMCQQVETILPSPFPDGAWEGGIDDKSYIAGESSIVYGIDMSYDRRWVSIAACGMREDGNYHIEVVARRVGSEWAVDWFRARAFKEPMRLAFQSRGAPVAGLAEQICTLPGVERQAVEGPELTAGWGRFYDAIAASAPVISGETARGGVRIFHLPQPILDLPGKTCQKRNIGNGIELPDRVKSPDDISPLIACFVAFSALTQINKNKNKIYESAYASGGELLLL